MRITAAVFWLLIHPLQASAQCPDGRPPHIDPGIPPLVCRGGECELNRSDARGTYHVFTVEPVVYDPGLSAGSLRDDDVIVAVDGALISTREAGERLAGVRHGEVVVLRIRRNGREESVRLVARARCDGTGLRLIDPQSAEQARIRMIFSAAFEMVRGRNQEANRSYRELALKSNAPGESARAPVDFGMALDCGNCGWRRVDGRLTFWSAASPIVVAVDSAGPAAAVGIRAGDVLVSLDGAQFVTVSDPAIWEALRPGRVARLVVQRGRVRIELVITPRRAGTPF